MASALVDNEVNKRRHMKRFAAGILLLTLLTTIPTHAEFNAAPFYWLSFLTGSRSMPAFWLMQISSAGRITVAPRSVFIPSSGLFTWSGVALSPSPSGSIRMYISDKSGHIHLLLIDAQTQKVISVQRIDLHTVQRESFAVTQALFGNFMTLKVPKGRLNAFPLDNAGSGHQSDHWPISLSNIGGNFTFHGTQQLGVSSDGRTAFWAQHGTNLMVQPLNEAGRPNGPSILIASSFGGAGFIGSADISGVLSGNKRFVVYNNASEDLGGTIPDHLMLQKIDAVTFARIGKRITLYSPGLFDINPNQSVAIDPLGRFFVYIDRSGQLRFQALNDQGKPRGSPVVLFPSGANTGVDILEASSL